jgi:predicted nucleic acid-binding protein
MRLFFDTSVLTAAFAESHSAHEKAQTRMHSAQTGRNAFLTGPLAGLYPVPTRLPVSPRIRSEPARRLQGSGRAAKMGRT